MGDDESANFESIDLAAYDLDGLRQDLVELADLQVFALRSLQWAVLGPVVVGALTWVVFQSQMPFWLLLPYALLAVVLSMVASALLATFKAMRGRVDAATNASSRVIDTLALAHTDLERLADGDASVSIKDLTAQVLELAVFPGLRDGVLQVVPVPLRFLARPVVWLPSKVVERTVMSVVDRLPVEQLGSFDPDDADAAAQEAGRLKAAYQSLPEDLANAQATLERTVSRVVNVMAVPLLILAALTAIPLVIWVGFGLLIS